MAPARSDTVFKVTVVGTPECGKSSLIKRIVSHRFDNLPTRNAEFMGMASDGKYVANLPLPPPFGKLGSAGPSHVLVEMQDQLKPKPDALLNEPFWFDVAPAEPTRSVSGMEDLSPRSKMLATTSVAASRAQGALDRSTEHWSKKLDPRAAKQAAAQAAAANHVPDLPPHPLMDVTFKANAVESMRSSNAAASDDGVSPLAQPRGTHGYLICFDLASTESFEEAVETANGLLARAAYDRSSKRACPVSVLLVGNKHDLTARGKRSGVTPARVVEVLAAYMQPGMLIPQLRKQRMDRPLIKLVDAVVAERKRCEESFTASAAAKTSVGNSKAGGEEDEEMIGLPSAVHRSIAKLKTELDPMRVSKSTATEAELLSALLACLEHPLAEKSEVSAGDLFEAIFCCPALGLKYMEISCKTNHQVHMLERLVVRSLRLLPASEGVLQEAAQRKKGAKGQNPLQSLLGMFGGGPESCIKFERASGAA